MQLALSDLKKYLINKESNQFAHVIESEEDVITTASRHPTEKNFPIICVSCVTGEGLGLLQQLLHLLPAGVNSKEQERLEQVILLIYI